MKKSAAEVDELRPEYGAEFFKDLKPNRFADRPKLGRVHRVARSAKRATSQAAKKRTSRKAR